MEIFSGFSTTDEPIELPPGFRFHPTDEELITHYLSPKLQDTNFSTKAIGDVDLNKVEPWDLPWRAKMGEKEWYFFCVRDRKYPNGLRTNRATNAGYWKATGKDKEIYRAKILIGMKKTLVFYRGRAPRGEKTNWVMHEYRLEGKNPIHNLPKTSKNEWVICRIFKKSSEGKKIHISGISRSMNCEIDSRSYDLPKLMEYSSEEKPIRNVEGSHVTCFSSTISSKHCDFSPYPFTFPESSDPKSILSSQTIPCMENLQDQSTILRFLLENNGEEDMKKDNGSELSEDTGMDANVCSFISNHEVEFHSCDDQEFPFISTGPVDLDCLWNY